VRDNVYFNRNLTKAEAEAAYRVRVQRRQAALRRVDNQQNRELRNGHTPLSNDQVDIYSSLSLLNIAVNPNIIVPPPPPTAEARAFISNNPASTITTASAAAAESRQQGRHDYEQ
jgi:hypothetical protein